MPNELSKYASNQFDVVTADSFSLMSEILSDTLPRVVAAVNVNADFTSVLPLLQAAITAWDAGETRLNNADANAMSRTDALEDKMLSLTRKPDADTNSPLETWDNIIRGQVAYQGPTYTLLLPQGRDTLTRGTLDQRLDAGRDFGIRLAAQTAKPALVTLGGTVTTFYTAARTLRNTQQTASTEVDSARTAQEGLRKLCAAELFGVVGLAMQVFKETPALVDTLFDVNLLRGGAQSLPEAPADTVWIPAQRRLTTTALPAGATRLAAWREGPGGMPEQLAVGERGALEVVIPANVTFDVGDLYQLWLVGLNGQGPSAPGPIQSWTAT